MYFNLGDVSPIAFHGPLVLKKVFPQQKLWALLREKTEKNIFSYCPETNFGLVMGQPQ